MAWAAGALCVGLASAILSIVAVATSIDHAGADRRHRIATEILEVDRTTGAFVRALVASPVESVGSPSMAALWSDFRASIDRACTLAEAAPAAAGSLDEICSRHDRLAADVVPALERLAREGRPVISDPLLSELVSVREAINALATRSMRDADDHIHHMADGYRQALVILVVSTAGFVCAAVILVLLVGRASVQHHEQSLKARQAAELLRETMDALPAGVVVYDPTDRLMMFNSVAASITPALSEPGAIGRSYEEMARDTARRLEAAGHGPQPVDEWIERFNSKRHQRTRQAVDGRWFDWSESRTPSGLTVGLRVDVTEVERARADYARLVDSLADVTYKIDIQTGRFTFVSASAREMFGVAPESMVGRHFLEFVAAESRERVQRSTTRAYDPNDKGTLGQFSMLTGSGEVLPVEVRSRRHVDENGAIISSGVIRDIGDRFRLEQQIEQQLAELQHARAEYRSLVDSLGDIVYKIDAATSRITFVNAAAAQFFGMPIEHIVGSDFVERVDPEHQQMLRDGIAREFRNTGRLIEVRFRVRAAGDEWRHVEIRYRRSLDEAGQLIVSGVMRDVEEAVRMERRIAEQVTALERARAEYQTLVDSLSDMIVEVDIYKGVFTFASAAAADLLGVPASQMIGRRVLDYIVTEDFGAMNDTARALLRAADGKPQHLMTRVRHADGGVRHLEVRMRKTHQNTETTIVSGVVRDVTDRVELERRLAGETARLRSIVESTGALIVLADRDLNVTMVNSGFSAITGLAASDALGRPLYEVLACPADAAFDRPLQLAVKMGSRLIALTTRPVTTPDGELSHVVLLGVDDTGRREAENALHDVERFATVGEMAATMAHELSQPLQVINIASASATDELDHPADEQKGPDIAFLRARLDRIARQVENASRVIGDLRAFVRGTNTPENVGVFDPRRSIETAVGLTGYGVRQAGAELRVRVADDLPRVAGESSRLEQVLVNLINNARDAGGRAIDIAAATVERDGRRCVRISVEDSGHGIDPEILSRLFVSFVTTKAKGKGTGLGLRICRRIVEEMGGTIAAANRAEGGARFDVLLPAA
ncbi:MAG: PAS domain S-box protein [Enhydrobacter sp.]|nr:MAG: PAS domain S-box protein [Enhydrobacter sp.]